MTEDQKQYIEQQHNVYVDIETEQFNLNGYDEVYGWSPIPDEWKKESELEVIL